MANKALMSLISILFLAGAICAQTASFTFQGKLNDGAVAANGTYQFQFKLFDANGNQVGQTLSDIPATVSNGIFTVNLDFGAESFNGAPRTLEIGVRLNGGGQNYTILSPRQPIASTPYAIRSLSANTAGQASNSLRLGEIPANQFVLTTDERMSDAREPLAGSANYIQNTPNQQSGTANFNISGEGKANVFNAATQFNINGTRILSAAGNDNIFVGASAGATNTTGFSNSFVGAFAGQKNTTGGFNSFFGRNAGQNNSDGNRNSFFGVNAGLANVSGSENSFFGLESGFNNSGGEGNAFFGNYSGKANTEGSFNSFFGRGAGESNTTGDDNAFFGQGAGFKNTQGLQNAAIGSGAGLNNTLGSRNTFAGYLAGASNTTENDNTFLGYRANGAAGITNATAIGANAVVTQSNTMVLGTNAVQVVAPGSLTVNGSFTVPNKIIVADKTTVKNGLVASTLAVESLPGGGVFNVCFFGAQLPIEFRACSSSLRYKNNVRNYEGGLEVIKRLRPVTFDWKENNLHDVGFVAEEVNAVEPLFSTFNQNNQIEGVKYAQITTALVNAVKEQQTQIERQNEENKQLQEQIRRQQAQIDALKALLCQSNPDAALCTAAEKEK